MLRFKFAFRCVLFCLITVVLMASPASTRAGSVSGILVPAYFYPGTGGPGGVGDGWTDMAAAAKTVPITAIFNPNSGPGPVVDQNYVNAISNLENAGGHVVAYVYSGGGSVPLATIEGEIQTYISQYKSLIQGFLIDGMLIESSTLSYYQSVYNYVKSLSKAYTVIGNNGEPFLNGVTPQEFLSTADVINIFDGPNTAPSPGAPGFDAYPYGLNWFQSYSSNRFSNIIFEVPSSAAMLADLNKAVQLNSGYVYVTDQTLPNPYGQLPSYWNQEVSAVHDLLSAPEPGSLTYLASAALCWPLALATRRRGSRAWCA